MINKVLNEGFDWNGDFANILETSVKQYLKKAEKETDVNPTPAQAEAGNYKKGRVTIKGLEIAIENPKGSYRRGVDGNGKKWEVKMNNTYGYFVQTKAIDGDAVDVFLGNNLESDKVFCIDQYKGNQFDETKVMLGFDTEKEAKEAYLSNYEKGWKGCKYVTELDTETFKYWLNIRKDKKQRKPIAHYRSLAERTIEESLNYWFADDANPEQDEYTIGMEKIEEETEINVLSEAKASEIHTKYYSNISKEDFNQIVSADPFSKLDRDYVSKYGVWLLSLYREGKLLLEDLYKATEYIPVFDKYRNKFIGLSVHNYPNIAAMGKQISSYIEIEGEEDNVEEGDPGGWERVYDDKNYFGIKPLTKEASIFWGRWTEWCTAKNSDKNRFEYYNSMGPMYIIINKRDKTDKYQFHYTSKPPQYMDKNDEDIKFTIGHPLLKPLGALQPKASMRITIEGGESILNKEGEIIFDPVEEIKRFHVGYVILCKHDDCEYALFNMKTKEFVIPYGKYDIIGLPNSEEPYLICQKYRGFNKMSSIDVYDSGLNKIASNIEANGVEEVYRNGSYHFIRFYGKSYEFLYCTETKQKTDFFTLIDDFDIKSDLMIVEKEHQPGLIRLPNEIIIPFGKYTTIEKEYNLTDLCYNLYQGRDVVAKWSPRNGYTDIDGNKIEEGKTPKTIIISESQLNMIKLHEMMDTRQTFPKLGITVDDVLSNITQCGGYDGLYPGSDDDTEDGDGFYPFDNKEQCLTKVYKICYQFDQFEDPIPVWRSIRVDKLSDIKSGDIAGNSWSFDQKSAVRFAASIWGNSGNTLLKAECPFGAVDWVETISRYIQDNTDGSNFNEGFSENEIYVEHPDMLLNIEVERTTLSEGKKYIQNLLDEARINEATAEEIHQIYYPNISKEDFNTIATADTISTNLERGKLGMYAKWLLDLYKKGILKLEDLYKAKKYIPVFDKMCKANKIKNKNINSYKSLSDMFVVIQPYFDTNQAISKSDEKKQIKQDGAEKVYEDGDFLAIHVKTQEAATYYGKGTQWCTAATDSDNYFEEYNKKGPLYVVINKKNNRKFQFHYETNQFMDENDSYIVFRDESEKLTQILGKLQPNEKMVVDYCIGFQGLLGKNGKWIIDPDKRTIEYLTNNGTGDVYILEDNDSCYVKNIETNEYIIPPEKHRYMYVVYAIKKLLNGVTGGSGSIYDLEGNLLYEDKKMGIVEEFSNGEESLFGKTQPYLIIRGTNYDKKIIFNVYENKKSDVYRSVIPVQITNGGEYNGEFVVKDFSTMKQGGVTNFTDHCALIRGTDEVLIPFDYGFVDIKFVQDHYNLYKSTNELYATYKDGKIIGTDRKPIGENINQMVWDYLNEIQLSTVKQQKKDDAARAGTLRDISWEEDDDNVDPEDRLEQIDEHKVDLLIDIINNKLRHSPDRFKVLKYILGDRSVNLSFLGDKSLIAKVNDVVEIIQSKVVTQKGRVNLYNSILDESDQSDMSGEERQVLRDMMSRLSNVPDTRNKLTKNAMENKQYVYDMVLDEVKKLAPTLFQNGEGQKKDFDKHLKSLRKGKGTVDHQLQLLVSEQSNTLYFDNINMTLNTIKEIVVDAYISQSGGMDIYPGYNPEDYDEDDADTYFTSKEQFERYCMEIGDYFDSLGYEIEVYRAIGVDKLNKIDYDYIGECWSSEFESAKTFGGRLGGPFVVLKGVVSSQDVDWKECIKLYVNFSGGWDGDDENEIRVNDSSYVRNIEIVYRSKGVTESTFIENIVREILYEKGILSEATASEIHQKYYSNISEEDFNTIVNSDKISSNLANNKLGMYAKWLLNLYKNGNLKLEDLYKAEQYLPVFDKLYKSNKLQNRNLNAYKSLPDMYDVVEPYLEKKSISKSDEKRDIKEGGSEKIYEDENWLLIHIKTKEAAIYYGKGTQWCTASTESKNYFDYYNSEGPLYVLFDKLNNKKYQFHKKSGQFVNENDRQIDVSKLIAGKPPLPEKIVSLYAKKEHEYGNLLLVGEYDVEKALMYVNGVLTGAFRTIDDKMFYCRDIWGRFNGQEKLFWDGFNYVANEWMFFDAHSFKVYPKLSGRGIDVRIGENLWTYNEGDYHAIVDNNCKTVFGSTGIKDIFYTDAKPDMFGENIYEKEGIYVIKINDKNLYYFNQETKQLELACENCVNGNDDGEIESLDEDNKRLKDSVFQIPEELYLELKNKYNEVKDNPKYTRCKNYKRLQNIIEKDGVITYKWMYTLVDWRDNYGGVLSGEKQDIETWLISADKLMKWVDEELKQATKSVKNDKEIVNNIAFTKTYYK